MSSSRCALVTTLLKSQQITDLILVVSKLLTLSIPYPKDSHYSYLFFYSPGCICRTKEIKIGSDQSKINPGYFGFTWSDPAPNLRQHKDKLWLWRQVKHQQQQFLLVTHKINPQIFSFLLGQKRNVLNQGWDSRRSSRDEVWWDHSVDELRHLLTLAIPLLSNSTEPGDEE